MDNSAPNLNKPNASPPPADDSPWLKTVPNSASPTPPPIEPPKTVASVFPVAQKTPYENPKPAPPPPYPRPMPPTIQTLPPLQTEKNNKPLEPSKIMSWIKGLAVVFVGLIIFGSLLLLLWPRLTSQSLNETKTVPSQSISITPPIDTVSGTATALLIPVATTTPETAIPITTGVPFIDETILKKQLGETVDFFLRDLMIFTDPKNPNRSFEIEALEFTDSRCPKSAVCVWAGERGLKLKITDKQSGASEEIYLGTRRAQIVKIMGLKITLFEIEDGKGGAYAKVKVE